MGLMSWSDDIRCLYCDGRLPLYRKITHGQFCSSAHRKAYQEEQQRLGVERLTQTHDSLLAYKPSPALAPAVTVAPEEVQAGLHALETRLEAERSVTSSAIANISAVPRASVEAAIPSLHKAIWSHVLPANPVSAVVASDPLSYDMDVDVRLPAHTHALTVETGMELLGKIPTGPWRAAGRSAAHPIFSEPFSYAPRLEPVRPAGTGLSALAVVMTAEPEIELLVIAAPAANPQALAQTPSKHAAAKQRAQKARAAKLAAQQAAESVQQMGARVPMVFSVSAAGAEFGFQPKVVSLHPLRMAVNARLPQSGTAAHEVVANPPLGHLIRMGLSGETRFVPAARPAPVAIEFHHEGAGVKAPELGEIAANPRLAPGCRYQTSSVWIAAEPVVPECKALSTLLLVTLPTWEPAPLAAEVPDPPRAGRVEMLQARKNPAFTPPRLGHILALPVPLKTSHVVPRLALEPRTPTFNMVLPVSGYVPSPTLSRLPVPPPAAREIAGPGRFAQLSHVWERREAKIVMMALPVLMGIALLSSGSTASAKSTSGFGQAFSSIRQSLAQRAAIALDEDFRQGLDDWTGRSGEPAAWAYDSSGFVQPGDLALFGPSSTLSDYQMQFLGMIDKKAMSWVVRAKDFQNYYVVKLVVTKPGPLPEIGLTRYAVIDGKAVDRVDTRVPLTNARADTLYRVNMDIRDDQFVLGVQGQMVDTWTEPRLDRGGVGFFTARGEESRVRWVQITHQYDMIGRLCAYLAPYEISNSGSLQP